MLWALPSSWPGRNFSALFSFAVAPEPTGALTVTLTIAELLTAPPIALHPQQGREFRDLMQRAATLLGAQAPRDTVRYAFRVEEHSNRHLFAVAFTAGVDADLRHVIVEASRADELGRLLEAAVNLLAAAAAADCTTPNSSPF